MRYSQNPRKTTLTRQSIIKIMPAGVILSPGIGQSIPEHTPHAVSVSLPTWASCVAYEEGEHWILQRMANGYPRFFVDQSIESFAATLIENYATPNEWAILLPSHAVALRCASYIQDQSQVLKPDLVLKVVDLVLLPDSKQDVCRQQTDGVAILSVLVYPKRYSSVAKSFWQHTGEGISSRRAQLCHRAFIDGFLVARGNGDRAYQNFGLFASKTSLKGPLRYQKGRITNSAKDDLLGSVLATSNSKCSPRDGDESAQFVEERYGRNLEFSLAGKAKLAIRRRIAGGLTANIELERTAETVHSTIDIRQVPGVSEDDVYLFPSGMSSIFNTHRIMMACRGPMRSVCFGFIPSNTSGAAKSLPRVDFRI